MAVQQFKQCVLLRILGSGSGQLYNTLHGVSIPFHGNEVCRVSTYMKQLLATYFRDMILGKLNNSTCASPKVE